MSRARSVLLRAQTQRLGGHLLAGRARLLVLDEGHGALLAEEVVSAGHQGHVGLAHPSTRRALVSTGADGAPGAAGQSGCAAAAVRAALRAAVVGQAAGCGRGGGQAAGVGRSVADGSKVAAQQTAAAHTAAAAGRNRAVDAGAGGKRRAITAVYTTTAASELHAVGLAAAADRLAASHHQRGMVSAGRRHGAQNLAGLGEVERTAGGRTRAATAASSPSAATAALAAAAADAELTECHVIAPGTTTTCTAADATSSAAASDVAWRPVTGPARPDVGGGGERVRDGVVDRIGQAARQAVRLGQVLGLQAHGAVIFIVKVTHWSASVGVATVARAVSDVAADLLPGLLHVLARALDLEDGVLLARRRHDVRAGHGLDLLDGGAARPHDQTHHVVGYLDGDSHRVRPTGARLAHGNARFHADATATRAS